MFLRSKDPSQKGVALLVVVFAVFLITIGFMLAMPVWQTQIQRELEEELIFRGKQYVEAVRVFQTKNPGRFPNSLDELLEEKCLRRLFRDPMSPHGEWNVILLQQQPRRSRRPTGARSPRGATQAGRVAEGQGASPQKVLIAPLSALDSIQTPQIIGVVSTSNLESFRIYNEQETYDKWLFFLGQDPKKLPEIVYYGQEEKDE
jgi:type II secretory pathway pseudopilin PulG